MAKSSKLPLFTPGKEGRSLRTGSILCLQKLPYHRQDLSYARENRQSGY
jgi:hypothetical protein